MKWLLILLQELHWLPIRQRINYKILLFAYKALHNLAPVYLSDLLKPLSNGRNLRSNSKSLLNVPKSNSTTYGDRGFSVAAPHLWNKLPVHIKLANSLDILKKQLKHFYFWNHMTTSQSPSDIVVHIFYF